MSPSPHAAVDLRDAIETGLLRGGPLLTAGERRQVEAILRLPADAFSIFANRTGRVDRPHRADEVSAPALAALRAAELVDGLVSAEAIARACTVPELRAACRALGRRAPAQKDALVDALRASIGRMYPKMADNPDYTSIVNAHHRRRIQALVDGAVAMGATAVVVNPADESFADAGNKMAPVILRGVTEAMDVMQEEIFGPVLPIVPVESVDAAIRYVADHPRPLALYYFDRDQARIDDLLRRTHSGGVTINDCTLHVAEEHLPFGGVGPSGMGAYHGKEGFDAMSHRKAVLHQARVSARFLTLPPYTERTERILDWLL